jgi:hypothetical protein
MKNDVMNRRKVILKKILTKRQQIAHRGVSMSLACHFQLFGKLLKNFAGMSQQ